MSLLKQLGIKKIMKGGKHYLEAYHMHDVRQAYCHWEGKYYWVPRPYEYPVAFFNMLGVVIFETEKELRGCEWFKPYRAAGGRGEVFNISKGISSLPRYKQLDPAPWTM